MAKYCIKCNQKISWFQKEKNGMCSKCNKEHQQKLRTSQNSNQRLRLAFLALPNKKLEMAQMCKKYEHVLRKHKLIATATTGSRILEAVDLNIECVLSGPKGGDQEIGGKIARKEIDIVFFFVDPEGVHNHRDDISALVRICNLYSVPLATNIGTGELLLENIKNHTMNSDSREFENK